MPLDTASFVSIIELLIEESGISDSILFKNLGMYKGSLSRWKRGTAVPKSTSIAAFAYVFENIFDPFISDKVRRKLNEYEKDPPAHLVKARKEWKEEGRLTDIEKAKEPEDKTHINTCVQKETDNGEPPKTDETAETVKDGDKIFNLSEVNDALEKHMKRNPKRIIITLEFE